MNNIGIMGAVPQEVKLVVDAIELDRSEEYAGVTYYIGRYAGKNVVVCNAGMGKVNAASTTQVLITRYGAEAILFTGVGGNLSSRAGMGEMVLGEAVFYHDADSSLIAESAPFAEVFMGDPALLDIARKACEENHVSCVVGRIATGDRFVGDDETKRGIIDRCSADCVEMEGAAIGQVAGRNGVPFVVLRAMSDDASKPYKDVVADIFNIDKYVANSSAIVLSALKAMP